MITKERALKNALERLIAKTRDQEAMITGYRRLNAKLEAELKIAHIKLGWRK